MAPQTGDSEFPEKRTGRGLRGLSGGAGDGAGAGAANSTLGAAPEARPGGDGRRR